jgi:hypothetical protein
MNKKRMEKEYENELISLQYGLGKNVRKSEDGGANMKKMIGVDLKDNYLHPFVCVY